MKTLFALLTLTALSTPTYALQYCALDVQEPTGVWVEKVHADRGEKFGSKTVNKLDDGDTCRSEGRKIGPDWCQDTGGVQYRTRAMKNTDVEKIWYGQC
jgi:hypothetical protein